MTWLDLTPWASSAGWRREWKAGELLAATMVAHNAGER